MTKKKKGKDPNSTNKLAKPKLESALTPAKSSFVDKDLGQELLTLLRVSGKGIFPETLPSSKEIIAKNLEMRSLSAKDRSKTLKQKRTVLMGDRKSAAKAALRAEICLGMAKCLRELQRGNLKMLVFDVSVQLESMTTVVESLVSDAHNECVVFGVENFSSFCAEVFGFSSVMFGLKKDSTSLQEFDPLIQRMKETQKKSNLKRKVSEPSNGIDKQSGETGDNRAKKSKADLDIGMFLLKRTEDDERVYQPPSEKDSTSDEGKKEEFGNDFISFD